MLHAPNSEAQHKAASVGPRPAVPAERELHPRLSTSISGYATFAASSRASSKGIPRQVAVLHHAYGNQALLRMLSRSLQVSDGAAGVLQRKCECGGSSGEGGECAECQQKREEGLTAGASGVQRKLIVNQPGDAYEQEADRIADQVMRMTDPIGVQAPVSQTATATSLQRQCACGGSGESAGECPACKADREGSLQHAAGRAGSVDSAPPIVHEVLRSPGQPLDTATRAFMEQRFGHDFSRVRLHTDAKGAQSARDLGALAYTVGNDVVFSAGHYAPRTRDGQHLLAHELTHTLQQADRSGVAATPFQAKLSVGGPGVHYNVTRMADSATPVVQRQAPSQPDLPSPLGKAATCSVDPFKLARALKGDKDAALDVLNCCESGLHPLPKGCTKDVIDGLRKILGKKPGDTTKCPPGFHPGKSKEFQGQCCRDGTDIESEQNCCPGGRIAPLTGVCCKEGEIPEGDKCAPPPPAPSPTLPDLCPPEWRTPFGLKCCPPPLVPGPFDCVTQVVPPPSGPAKPPPSTPAVAPPVVAPVFFNFDRPHGGEGLSALDSCLTGEGKTNLNALIAQLRANASFKVQLVGRASPEGTSEYNLALGGRRARMVADALADAGIAASRIGDAPGGSFPAGCQTLGAGLKSCGEIGASGEGDRQVVPTLFAVGSSP